ncbi:hypothetical protein GCM10023087_14710 [Microbacterium rhizosphaerae]
MVELTRHDCIDRAITDGIQRCRAARTRVRGGVAVEPSRFSGEERVSGPAITWQTTAPNPAAGAVAAVAGAAAAAVAGAGS